MSDASALILSYRLRHFGADPSLENCNGRICLLRSGAVEEVNRQFVYTGLGMRSYFGGKKGEKRESYWVSFRFCISSLNT